MDYKLTEDDKKSFPKTLAALDKAISKAKVVTPNMRHPRVVLLNYVKQRPDNAVVVTGVTCSRIFIHFATLKEQKKALGIISNKEKSIGGSVNKHASKKTGRVPKVEKYKLTESELWDLSAWLLSNDTGASSKFMAAVAIAAGKFDPRLRLDYPYDAPDLGRCVRLIEKVPSIKKFFPSIRLVSPEWEAYIEHWDELTALWHKNDYRVTTDRMRAVITKTEDKEPKPSSVHLYKEKVVHVGFDLYEDEANLVESLLLKMHDNRAKVLGNNPPVRDKGRDLMWLVNSYVEHDTTSKRNTAKYKSKYEMEIQATKRLTAALASLIDVEHVKKVALEQAQDALDIEFKSVR